MSGESEWAVSVYPAPVGEGTVPLDGTREHRTETNRTTVATDSWTLATPTWADEPTPVYDALVNEGHARAVRESMKAAREGYRYLAEMRARYGVKPGESLDAAIEAAGRRDA